MDEPSLSPLSRELERATLLARRPLLADKLRSIGLPPPGELADWGVDLVRAGPDFYEPQEDGTPALIVPIYEQRELVDLVACSFESRQMRRRRGIVPVLGLEWIEWSTFGNDALRIFDDAFSWQYAGRAGVAVINWKEATPLLRDVPALHCQSRRVAARLVHEFERPRPYPPVYVSNGVAS